jgi:hypothetical protein
VSLRLPILVGMSRSEDHDSHPGVGGADALPTLLPRNLAASLQHLPEQDLVRLWDAVAAEMQRRGLAQPKQRELGADKDQLDPILSQLTRPQISLIRSSIKAGVKPTALQRQFGLTRAQITAALKGSD